jgi:hypothetical protein
MNPALLEIEDAPPPIAGSRPKITHQGFEARTWPDDCPACATRMQFEFQPMPARVCACGVRITQRDLTGGAVLPIKRKKRR